MRRFEPLVIGQSLQPDTKYFIDRASYREPNLWVPGEKPIGPVKIDWRHPLTAGLRFAVIFNQSTRDLALGNFPVTVKGSSIIADGNPVWDFNDSLTEYLDYGRHSEFEYGTALTAICRFNFDDQSADHSVVAQGGAVDPGWYLDGFNIFGDVVGVTYNNTISFYSRDGTDVGRLEAGTDTMSPGTWNTVTYTFDALNVIRGYLNGAEMGDSPKAISSVNDLGNCDEDLIIGDVNQIGAKSYDGKVSYVYLWDRVLTRAESLSIEVDPYQFLIPA